MFSDRLVKSEPAGVYRCHHGSDCPVTPDGALLDATGRHVVFDVVYSSGRMSSRWIADRKANGHHTVADRERAKRARDATYRDSYERQRQGHLTPDEADRLRRAADTAVQDAYHPGYAVPCAVRGDSFYPVVLSIYGGWYPEASGFLAAATHSGDRIDGRCAEAERFDHHSRTWASWSHSVFLMQAVACAAARAQYRALRRRALEELARAGAGQAAGDGGIGAGEGVAPPSPRPAAV